MSVIGERRQFGRRNTHLQGWITIPGRPKVPCLVTNLSQAGAFLELTAHSWLPFDFELYIELLHRRYRCETRHKGPTGVGVSFILDVKPSPDKQFRRVTEPDQWTGGSSSSAPRSSRPR